MPLLTNFTKDESTALSEKITFWRMLFLPTMFAGFAALFFGWPSEQPTIVVALWLITGYAMFCGTSCLHEAAHQTLWPSKQANIWSGRCIGSFILTPYSVYRETHIYHHAYLNRPEDWEMWPYCDPNRSLAFRRCFAWFDLLLGMFASPIIFGRIYFSSHSPIKKRAIRRAIRNEYVHIVLFWVAVIALAAYLEITRRLVWAIVPPWIVASFIQTIRKFTEHLGMSNYDPLHGTRTVVARSWLLKLSSFLNFDIFVHGVHHRHPKLAHDLMTDKVAEYQQDNPHVDYPVYYSYWRATLAMLPYLFRNPGSGINAGGIPLGPIPEDRQLNFVSDVVEEISGQHERPADQSIRSASV